MFIKAKGQVILLKIYGIYLILVYIYCKEPTTMKSLLTEKDKEFIRINYPKLGAIGCAKIIHHPKKRITGYASKNGILVSKERLLEKQRDNANKAIEARAEKYLLPNSYHVNPDIFRIVKTPEAAYILGLLWADGYIYKDSIKIEATKDDLEMVEWIFDKTGTWSKQYRNRMGKKAQMTIATNNRMIKEFLESCDYISKSSASACKIIKQIPEHLHHYWWRGLFDGDGCFYIGKEGATQASIASSYEQNWKYVETLFDKLNIKFYKAKREQRAKNNKINKSSYVRITKREDIVKFGEYIYQNIEIDKIGFSRKYKKFLKIKKIHRDGQQRLNHDSSNGY